MAHQAEETAVKPRSQWWIGPVKGSGIFQKCFIGDISGSDGSHWIPSWIIPTVALYITWAAAKTRPKDVFKALLYSVLL